MLREVPKLMEKGHPKSAAAGPLSVDRTQLFWCPGKGGSKWLWPVAVGVSVEGTHSVNDSFYLGSKAYSLSGVSKLS